MVKYVPDRTGRFSTRPHYTPRELDRECEQQILAFFERADGAVVFPISTDDLTRFVEQFVDDLDLYADLSSYGPNVEGLTAFRVGERPDVRISERLASEDRRQNRLRTTLTHEWGHVHFHNYLWEMEPPSRDLLKREPDAGLQICKRDSIIDAKQIDWMEWQAGYVCGAILMPKGEVTRLASTVFEAERVYGCAPTGSPQASMLIDLVTEKFAVSEHAARVRLSKLGLIGAAQGPSLFDAIG